MLSRACWDILFKAAESCNSWKTYLCPISSAISTLYTTPGGGGEVLALEMGRGVPPACSKPDPVPIRLAVRETPCPILETNTELN